MYRLCGSLHTHADPLPGGHRQLAGGAFPLLVYPHLAYLRTRLVRDPKRAELQHLVLDAILLGAWAAVLHYSLWPLISFLVAVTINNAMTSGLRGAVKAVAAYAAGALGWGAVTGFPFQPETGPAAIAVCIIGGLAYTTNVALLVYSKNRQLIQAKRQIEHKNAVFQSLLSVSMATHQADDVEPLFAEFAPHLHRVLPEAGFGVILRGMGRPRLIRNIACSDIGRDAQDWLLEEVGSLERIRGLTRIVHPQSGEEYYAMSMHGHLKQMDGVFVVRRQGLSEDAASTISLFVDQLAAALESQLLTKELKKLASTDPLTGTANRARLNRELARAIHNKRGNARLDFSIVMIDLNGLKAVNDTHGHDAGDALIQRAARLLLDCCRESDTVARFGGDEFVILCPGTTRNQCEHLLQRIRAQTREAGLELPAPAGEPLRIPLRMSMGVADSRESAPEAVLTLADERMYASKRAYYRQLAAEPAV